MIKNVIFDMDGTILNTLDDICDSVNYMMVQCGYAPLDIDVVRSYVGSGVKVLIERCLPGVVGDEFNNAFSIFRSHYDVNKNNKTAPYDGIIAVMHELKSRGYSMAVVSNKYDIGVKQLTAELFGDYITVAIGESESIKPKPLPDGVNLAMSMLMATTANSVYIGDSEVDFATAVNSNLPFIGVTWGFRTRKFLESLGADNIIDSPDQILSAIASI